MDVIVVLFLIVLLEFNNNLSKFDVSVAKKFGSHCFYCCGLSDRRFKAWP